MLDHEHPLAKDLVSAFEGDITQGFFAIGTRVAARQAGAGRGFGATLGAGDTDSVTTSINYSRNQRTFFASLFLRGGGGGGLGRILEKRTGDIQAELWFILQTGSRNGLAYENGSKVVDYSDYASLEGREFTTAIRVNESGIDPDAFIDGRIQTPKTPPTISNGTNNDPYVIGNRRNDNARAFDGIIFCSWIYDRLLSDEEIKEVHENRFQIFRADPVRIYSLPPVLTIPTLSNPGVIDITATSARPQVTLAY